MTASSTWILALSGLIAIPAALAAAQPPASETDPYCSVSSEEIVAGTSDQGVMLESAGCTERLRRFLRQTTGEVRQSYGYFFEALHADPKTIDALSALIARDQLLSTGWMSLSGGSLSHGQSAADAGLLRETNAALQQLLTQEEFASLKKYQQSLPTRELLKPVVARLHATGKPPSREQLERAVEDVQSWAAGLMDRAEADGINEIRTCEQADAFTNRREAQLLAVLAKSLDESQASVARAYYRERAEQRAKQLSDYHKRAGTEPCMAVQFKRP